MEIKAVIFDLDGTITEQCLDFDLIRRDIGLKENVDSILEYLEKLPSAERERALAILEHHEDAAALQSNLNHGVRETIDLLHSRGIKVGILTRNKRNNAILVQEKHKLHFDAIFAREDGPAKPDPHGVLELCKLFKCSPVETLLVGDFLHDLLTAKAAGSTAVLIETHKNAPEFRKHADLTIRSISEIIAIIDNALLSKDTK